MIRVNVEGSPEAVAKFFKEMGSARAIGALPALAAHYGLVGESSDCVFAHSGGKIPPFNNVHETKNGAGIESTEQKTPITNVTIVNTKESSSEESSYIEEKINEIAKTGKKPGRPKKEKAETPTSWGCGPLSLDKQPKFAEPEVVAPDPEFSDLPDVAENATTEAPKVVEELEKPSVTREMVQAALKEYGIWLQQTGEVKQGQIRSYLYALTKKFGNGVSGTPDLEEQCFEAVMQSAVSRVPVSELKEYL